MAPTNSRVLISGPAGSGKEVLARLIHARSRRSPGPFLVLNCASMSPERMEVELFGMEGPLEGAAVRKVGTFEAAHNGTLLLDEVADLPPETQGKIVRVLQEQTFQRVGGETRVDVNVRVIASTTRDLGEEIRASRFREDLFYRLSVVPLRVPHCANVVMTFLAGPALHGSGRGKFRTAAARHQRGRDGGAADLRLAGECSRVAQHHRAAADHGAGRNR